MKFSSFLDIKNKKIIKELKILKEVLSKKFEVKGFLESTDNPYLFLKSNKNDLSFDGVRIYKIGSELAYRIQNEAESEPFGKAYPLNMEEMYEELIPDISEEEAAKAIAHAVVEEFENFFKKSAEVVDEEMPLDKTNIVIAQRNNGDYTFNI